MNYIRAHLLSLPRNYIVCSFHSYVKILTRDLEIEDS
jgi:hypothetical protein